MLTFSSSLALNYGVPEFWYWLPLYLRGIWEVKVFVGDVTSHAWSVMEACLVRIFQALWHRLTSCKILIESYTTTWLEIVMGSIKPLSLLNHLANRIFVIIIESESEFVVCKILLLEWYRSWIYIQLLRDIEIDVQVVPLFVLLLWLIFRVHSFILWRCRGSIRLRYWNRHLPLDHFDVWFRPGSPIPWSNLRLFVDICVRMWRASKDHLITRLAWTFFG